MPFGSVNCTGSGTVTCFRGGYFHWLCEGIAGAAADAEGFAAVGAGAAVWALKTAPVRRNIHIARFIIACLHRCLRDLLVRRCTPPCGLYRPGTSARLAAHHPRSLCCSRPTR